MRKQPLTTVTCTRRTTHVVVQQTLEALVDGDRFELVRDDHTNEGTHGGIHAARWSSDIDNCHSLVLATHTSHHSLMQNLNNNILYHSLLPSSIFYCI